jgi:dTDP-4-amino-4,6-dideoxygalactose transaminase
MKNFKKIQLSTPHMSDQGFELQNVIESFRTNWIAPLGPMVDGFENDIIEYTGSKYAVALSSGTAAIHLSLKAIDIKEGDIVFCQSMTFAATANPILYEKAVPVFIDSEESTWNMSPKFLRQAFKKYPNAKAVIVVHLYGIPAQLDEIIAICKEYNVPLIEDAAESLGSKYKEQYTGTFGTIGIFSFNGNKIITTSGGGMAVSNDKEKIDKIRFWATQSKDKARHYEHSEIGYNYRMSNVSAAIGRGQMKVLDNRISKRKEIYSLYRKLLSLNENIKFLPTNDDVYFANNWLSTIQLMDNTKVIPLIEYLEKFDIETRPLWKPMHLQPVFSAYDYVGNDISERLFKHGICLPSDSKLSFQDIETVATKIKDFFNL